jgi:outer membrane protein
VPWGVLPVPLAVAALSAALAGAPDAARPQQPEPHPQQQAAAAPTVPSMTLREALDYAAQHQPSLAASRARLSASLADAAVPGTTYYPRLGVTLQAFEGTTNNTTALYDAAPPLDLPRIGATRAGTTSWDPSASTLAAIGVRQEIFDFGRVAAQQAIADAAVEAERGLTDATRLDVDYAVESAYYAVLTAKSVRDVAESALQRSRLNHDMASAGVAAQLRDPIELTRADADLSRFQVARVHAEAGLAAAEAVFAAVVGVPEPLLEVAGAAPAPQPAPNLRDAIAQALADDPILREKRARLREQMATTRSIATELRPDFSLTSTLSGRAGDALPSSGSPASSGGWLPEVPNWDVGLLLSWPLFDQGVRARKEASRAREEERKAEIVEEEQQLRARVERVVLDLRAAQLALPALEKSRTAARANYEQAEARFKAELGSSVELADAQALLAEAEIGLTVGRYDVSRARARLARLLAEGR